MEETKKCEKSVCSNDENSQENKRTRGWFENTAFWPSSSDESTQEKKQTRGWFEELAFWPKRKE